MPDLLIKSRSIFTGNGGSLRSGAVSIRDGLISGIIDQDELAAAESQTSDSSGIIIDCGSRLVMPGFCDSHIHAFLGALQLQSADLTGCTSETECVEAMHNYYGSAGGSGSGGWLSGFGWNHYNWTEQKLPGRHSLDAVFRDRPVCLFNEEMHSAWVNTAALKAAGITSATPQPSKGRIFVDANGEPDGYLLEPEAMLPVMKPAFNVSHEREEELIRGLLKHAARFGITSFSDVALSDNPRCGVYEKLLAEGSLSCRVHPVFLMSTDIAELEDLRLRYDSDFLRFSGVKEFLDGTAAMYTGMLVDGYADRPGFNAGPLVDVDSTIEKAAALDRLDIRVRFHACGAGAVRLGLDIFEEVRKRNGFRGTRHTIEHIENIHPDDLPRFQSLGITASVQPDHLWSETYEGHPFRKILGEARCRWTWPFKSILDAGADTAFGTDFPVSTLNPLQGIYRAMTRLHEDGKPDGGWNPEEKLTLEESLIQYTSGSSRQMNTERLTGKLVPGLQADIAVIDGSLFEMDPHEIRHAGVYMTVSAGRIVHGPV